MTTPDSVHIIPSVGRGQDGVTGKVPRIYLVYVSLPNDHLRISYLMIKNIKCKSVNGEKQSFL